MSEPVASPSSIPAAAGTGAAAPAGPPADTPGGDSPAALRAVAERIVREAAEHLRGLPRPWDAERGAGVATKSTPTDVVTASDTAIETLVRERLAALRPGEAVLGEEHGGAAGEGISWVVDPIDGTVNFFYGLPWYAVSLAAVHEGRSLAGAVIEPSSGRLWSAALGEGATCDGAPLCASAETDVTLSLLGTGYSYDVARRQRQARMVTALLAHVRDIRRTGSAALDLCAVAAGWTDAYVEHGCNWWDWAAAALIASEAGAVVRTPGATGTTPPDDGLGAGALFAAAPGVAEEIAGLIRANGAAEV